MTILSFCPQCGVHLEVPESSVGKMVRCGSCANVFEARAEGQAGGESNAPGKDADVKPRPRNQWDDDDAESDGDDSDFNDRKRRGMRRDLLPHRGGLILGLGIGSIILSTFCPPFGLGLGIPAWIMGRKDLSRIDSGEMDADGRGITQGGFICGIIGTALNALCLLGCVGYIIVLIAVASSAGR